MDAHLYSLALPEAENMNLEPRETAVAESYPTFWIDDELTPPANPMLIPAAEAYEAFVTLCEDDLPDDDTPGSE